MPEKRTDKQRIDFINKMMGHDSRCYLYAGELSFGWRYRGHEHGSSGGDCYKDIRECINDMMDEFEKRNPVD